MKTLKELSSEILGFRSILLFCHIRPDGDTLGSAVALCLALRQKGIKCDIICDGKILPKYCLNDTFLGILPVETQLERYDAHISVDIPGEHLFGRAWGIYSAGEKVYAIDHHLSNSRYTKNLCLEQLPANALVIYKLLIEMKVEINPLSSSNVDVMLYSVLESEQALKGYAAHPEHVFVADTKVRPYTEVRSCIDFEF